MDRCPICASELPKGVRREASRVFVECLRCGVFSISETAEDDLDWLLTKRANSRAILSHAIYKMTKGGQRVYLKTEALERIIMNVQLPRPKEQLDNFLLWLGERQPTLGTLVDETASAVAATGTGDEASLGFLIKQAIAHGYVAGEVVHMLGAPAQAHSLHLTITGWDYFEALVRGISSSRIAFMAMKFGDEQTDNVYHNRFKQAVEATGFVLKRIDEGQPAGLIDDRLRVEIRQCRFLIADLTHHNNGAYWEAGYAEGLGKPVIYTCRKDVFDDKQKGTHFDTNHHLTVTWDPAGLDNAVAKLKATIRATLPGEAKLADS